MNFMFHTMLDAAGVVLRVHYKSMKCDVLIAMFYFHKVADMYIQYLGEVDIFTHE